MSHTLQNIKTSRDDAAWEVEIKAEIPVEALAGYREEALKEIQKSAKLDGFRPGKAPIERIIEVYGEGAIQRLAAEHAIQHELPELLAAEKLLIIESPRVTTDTPIAGKPLVFTARAPLSPQVTLPDYKKIAAKHPSAGEAESTVSDKEHADALVHLRRERARIDKLEAGAEPQKASEESRAMKEEELPALDDMFVQSLGYESAVKFSEALRTNMKTEKEAQTQEKRRAALIEDLVKGAKVSYPAKLREYELDDMEARMSAQGGSASGGKDFFEVYLKQIGKTREQLRKEWGPAADKRAKVRLILTEIALSASRPRDPPPPHRARAAQRRRPQFFREPTRVAPVTIRVQE